MRDFIEFVAFAFVGILAVTGLFVGLVASVDYLDCRGFERGTGVETRWTWGCYAQVDGQWVPKKYVFGEAAELRVKAGD